MQKCCLQRQTLTTIKFLYYSTVAVQPHPLTTSPHCSSSSYKSNYISYSSPYLASTSKILHGIMHGDWSTDHRLVVVNLQLPSDPAHCKELLVFVKINTINRNGKYITNVKKEEDIYKEN